MNKGKALRIGGVILGSILCIVLILLFLPRLIVLFLPFILAYLLYKVIDPLVTLLQKRCRIPRTVGTIIGMVLAMGVLGTVLGMVASRLWKEANDILAQSDTILEKITQEWEAFRNTVLGRFRLAAPIEPLLSGLGKEISGLAASYTMPALKGAFGVVKSLPSGIVFTIVFLLSTFFISSDKEKMREGILRITPKGILQIFEGMLKNVFLALGAYIKAQLTMICITFLELTIGFLILGGEVASHALVLALTISIIDAVPILGTGTVLIPWGIFALLTGDIRMGVMLIALYLICLAVRQMIEPRLVARQIGIHPLLVLMSMYIGLRFIGIFGMLLGPVLALVIKHLYAEGVFAAVGRYIEGKDA